MPRESRLQNSLPRISERQETHLPQEKDGVPRGGEEAEKTKVQDVVESTFKENPRAPTKACEEPTFGGIEKANIEKMIEEVLQQKKIVHSEEDQRSTRFPFTKEILQKPLPQRFKMPQLPSFTGKEDPYEHMQTYEAIMLLHGWEDAIMCRAFPITLKDAAQIWFNRLKESSISSFEQLRKEFVNAFIINSRRKKDTTYLLSIKQGEKETLKQYVDRFRNATLEIHEPQSEVVVAAMLQGTHSTQLQESLSLDQPKSLAELFVRANKYIRQAEVLRIVNPKDDKERKRKDRDRHEETSKKKENVGDSKGSIKLQHKKYTPLTESRSSILATIEGSGLISLPPKTNQNLGRNTEAYCQYHDTYGHSTNKCHVLMNKIESLIRNGELKEFVDTEALEIQKE